MKNGEPRRVVGVANGAGTGRRGGGLCVEGGRVLQLRHVGDGEKVKVADDGATACRLSFSRVSANATARGAREAIAEGKRGKGK